MFAQKLKFLRSIKKISQEQLAKDIGVERSTIGKYESKANVIPSVEVLKSLAQYFNVSIDYLLGADTVLDIPIATKYPSDFRFHPRQIKGHTTVRAVDAPYGSTYPDGQPILRELRIEESDYPIGNLIGMVTEEGFVVFTLKNQIEWEVEIDSGEDRSLVAASEDEQSLIFRYRSLDSYGKEAVGSILEIESKRCFHKTKRLLSVDDPSEELSLIHI